MRSLVLTVALVLPGCTNGAPAAGGSALPPAGATTIDVSLTSFAASATPYGAAGGYAPPVTTVATGTMVRFVNRDSFAHTATAVAGASFPAAPGFDAAALDAHGARLGGGWSSGSLAAGASSPPLLADAAGTYLYGCFFHYGAPMRGAIVVR